MRKAIFEILEEASQMEAVDQRALHLKRNDCPALRYVLEGVYNPLIKWMLPKGTPPYKLSEVVGAETQLHSHARKLYLFVEGGQPGLKPARRELLFIELLESIHPKDAELLILMKDKKMPYKGITKNVVKKAFPEMKVE
jgi:hypothetical protein